MPCLIFLAVFAYVDDVYAISQPERTERTAALYQLIGITLARKFGIQIDEPKNKGMESMRHTTNRSRAIGQEAWSPKGLRIRGLRATTHWQTPRQRRAPTRHAPQVPVLHNA